jgi:hypothetical protein
LISFPVRSYPGYASTPRPSRCPAPARSWPRAAVPVPTLGRLLHQPYWLWLCCSCGHRVAVALVPFVIRWGADASSDMLRQRVRCVVCGRRGASLQHPSWGDAVMGLEGVSGRLGASRGTSCAAGRYLVSNRSYPAFHRNREAIAWPQCLCSCQQPDCDPDSGIAA